MLRRQTTKKPTADIERAVGKTGWKTFGLRNRIPSHREALMSRPKHRGVYCIARLLGPNLGTTRNVGVEDNPNFDRREAT
jgi:hypothetical protein